MSIWFKAIAQHLRGPQWQHTWSLGEKGSLPARFSSNFALQILKETCNFMWTGIWPSVFSWNWEEDGDLWCCSENCQMERGIGELSLSNARNRKVKIRFFLQPSHSALNKPASKNLGRATGEPLLHLFLSPTFSPLLTHPLDRKVFQAETTLCDARALDKGGLQSHVEASRSYTAANNSNGACGGEVSLPDQRESHCPSVFSYPGFSDPGLPRPLTFVSSRNAAIPKFLPCDFVSRPPRCITDLT